MVAPVLPWLTDSAEQLDHLFGELAAAGANGVTPLVLHLRPGVKEWFMTWLAQERPDLVTRYQSLYAHGSNAAPSYQNAFAEKVRPLLNKHGFGQSSRHRSDPMTPSNLATSPNSATPARFRPPHRHNPARIPQATPDINQQTLF